MQLFGDLVPYFKEFTKPNYTEFRAAAFQCLGAIVDKGMSEVDKIQVIKQLEFLELLQKTYLESRDWNDNQDEELQETETEYFTQVANSIFGVGQWSLQLYLNHTKILQSPDDQQAYVTIQEFLLSKAIDLLDSDKPKIGRPLVQFLLHWVNAHVKMP